MIKIVADNKIPYIHELFGPIAHLTVLSGDKITPEKLRGADVLLIRTITPVNATLLQGTSISFVASATAGHDHLDTQWLNQRGIAWAFAAGANATAVAEYVLCCVAELRNQHLLPLNGGRAAVIGVGQVGSRVVDRLQKIGMEVICNDPLRARQEKDFFSAPLEALTDVDLICLHTPLTINHEFPTYHLINTNFLARLKPGCVLLNAGRGAVVDNQALLKNNHVIACLDVWENELNINLDLLKQVAIATPHIAGYSEQAKLKASLMIYHQVLQHFHLNAVKIDEKKLTENKKITINIKDCHRWEDIVLKIYQPSKDTLKMRETLLTHPQHVDTYFEKLRQEYILRQEFSAITFNPPLSQICSLF